MSLPCSKRLRIRRIYKLLFFSKGPFTEARENGGLLGRFRDSRHHGYSPCRCALRATVGSDLP